MSFQKFTDVVNHLINTTRPSIFWWSSNTMDGEWNTLEHSNLTKCTVISSIRGGPYVVVLYTLLNVLSGVLSVTGNSFVLIAVYKTHSLQVVSNFFICSLAMADLMVGVIANPLNIVMTNLRLWGTDLPLDKASDFLWPQTLITTTFNLTAISIDRLIAVKWPLRYSSLVTTRVSYLVIAFVWIASILFGLPVFFLESRILVPYWVGCSVLTFFISLTSIFYCYIKILRISHRQLRTMIFSSNGSFHLRLEEKLQALKNRKAVFTLSAITTVFLISFFPSLICSILFAITEGCKNKSLILDCWIWFIFLMYTSSFLNPLIYGLRSKGFRTVFRRFLDKTFAPHKRF